MPRDHAAEIVLEVENGGEGQKGERDGNNFGYFIGYLQ